MKHPVRFFAVLFLVLSAVAAAIVATIRYMDVLQEQFDFLRGLLARRNARIPDIHDGDYDDEFDDEEESEVEAPFAVADDYDGVEDDLKL